jgi:hypothetical protein
MTKVKLLVRKGQNEAGSVIDTDDGSAAWLVRQGYAEEVKETTPKKDAGKPAETSAPRRGRPPRKEES